MCSPGESETIFTGKLIASLTTCHSTSSGTSGAANGFTTRKHTSVNGSARNSSNSSGDRRAISTGIYNPPSGANPRNTAPRSDVSGASRDVLRYLISVVSVKYFYCDDLPTSGGFNLPAYLLQESFYVSSIVLQITSVLCPQLGHMYRAMRQCFITFPPPPNKQRATPRPPFAGPFLILHKKPPPPQHRLRIIQISFHQYSLFIFSVGQMHDCHLPPQAHQNIVLRVDHAPGRIQNYGCAA